MKWRTEKTIPQGTLRKKARFAFLPKKAEDGYTYWLEYVVVEEKYEEREYSTGWWGNRVTGGF